MKFCQLWVSMADMQPQAGWVEIVNSVDEYGPIGATLDNVWLICDRVTEVSDSLDRLLRSCLVKIPPGSNKRLS